MGVTHAEQSSPAGSYDVILQSPDIAHPSFSDVPLLFAGQVGYPETSVVLHNHQLIEEFVRAFLDKNLKQAKAPLLDGANATSAEATVKSYGTPVCLLIGNPEVLATLDYHADMALGVTYPVIRSLNAIFTK
jgi:hypothetical protein